MSQAEEIERLAQLRDRGVLTTKEFEKKKKQILNGDRTGPSRFMTAVAGVVAFMIIAGFVTKLVSSAEVNSVAVEAVESAPLEPASVEMPASDPDPAVPGFEQQELACDLPEITEKITRMVNQQWTDYATRSGGPEFAHRLHILGVGTTTELYRDPESGFIACLGDTRHSNGAGKVAFTVSWADRNIGQFWVELADVESLTSQYGAR